jgi:F-type H+-transporting ATPase subunit epsilon
MAASIHVDIVSAEGHIHHGEAAMVFALGESGEIGIAPRHAPLLTRLKPGAVRLKQDNGEEQAFFVGGGILEVQPSLVTVLADTAMHAKDCDEARVAEAKHRAEQLMGKAKTEVDIARAQAELVQATALAEFLDRIKKATR